MNNNNRFGKLLEYLMSTADIKNYVLANELQYDVSYVSKWINGKMIPSEKTKRKVLENINNCIVTSATEDGLARLKEDYEVTTIEELQAAIYDNLEAEYDYVKDKQKNVQKVNEKIQFYGELPIRKFILKIYHPVLRRVKNLDIMACMDIMNMRNEYRFESVGVKEHRSMNSGIYENVHYSLVLNIDLEKWDKFYDTLFLVNALERLSYVDFSIYHSEFARNNALFTVKDEYAISGILTNQDRLISVVATEEKEHVNVLYYNINDYCRREQLLFRQFSLADIINNKDYSFAMLAPNKKWILGHLTEHFLTDDLFEEILGGFSEEEITENQKEVLRRMHLLNRRILEKEKMKIVLIEAAISEIAISGKFIFFDKAVTLTPNQRKQFLEHMTDLIREENGLEFKLAYGWMANDYEYTMDQCLLISDTYSYLRLKSNTGYRNVMQINQIELQKIFSQFVDDVWEADNEVFVDKKEEIIDYFNHMIQGIDILAILGE